MESLGALICGGETEGIAKTALDQLATSISSFSEKALYYLHNDATQDTQNFGPFCARVILENSCAALVGRLDTFRLMYLSEFQSQVEYIAGKRARSSFSWTGDVIPDDRQLANLWHIDNDLAKISRALFSRYQDHLHWRPAVENLLDFLRTQPPKTEHYDILMLDAENFTDSVKGKSVQLYSTLSKGVHWEFFSSAFVFDAPSVKTHIQDTLLLVSQLGLISHFIPTAHASLSYPKALEAYVSFLRRIK